ncbi:MAG: NAD-dependent epimerase/dehydratase family protein [Desulfobacteraceae bacterium]|nr:NAD-dependent epimerase/dehydratase family protein [Desulfobacteraceae bacterium]
MNVLVTGAAGYIGGKMVKSLCKKSWVDTVVGTDIREPDFHHPKYKFDIRDIRYSLDDLFENHAIDTVVHAAYVLPPIHDKGLMEDINKGGTRNILEASAKAGVKQILYTSSTTAYGFYADNDDPLTENSPLRGNDDLTYAKNKREIEAILQEFIAAHPGIAATIVRPCFVVGPGFTNPLARHLRKKLVIMPSGTRPWQFVHEDDLIQVMVLLLEKRIAGAFNVTGEGTITFPEMINMLGNIRIPVPWPVIYPLNNLFWFLRLSFMTAFPSPAMRMMVHPWIASSKKLHKATGYPFKYSSKSAFADFVRSVKN